MKPVPPNLKFAKEEIARADAKPVPISAKKNSEAAKKPSGDRYSMTERQTEIVRHSYGVRQGDRNIGMTCAGMR